MDGCGILRLILHNLYSIPSTVAVFREKNPQCLLCGRISFPDIGRNLSPSGSAHVNFFIFYFF